MTITNGNTKLTYNTDYSLSYKNNVNTGTASVIATGKGNYTGSVTKTFQIKASDFSKCDIQLSASSFTYDGTEKKPEITVKSGSKLLVSGTDYAVSYSNNINVGTASVAITGKGKYSGTITKAFSINPADFTKASVTLSASSFTWDGTEKKPSVTVKIGNRQLTANTDYTVSYSANTKVGTVEVTITGTGSYIGEIKSSFDILPAKQQIQKLETRFKGFFIDWAQKGSATGYEIEYSTNADFKDSTVKKLTANKPDTLTISGLTAGNKYYVRVRSYTNVGEKVYYGAWSDSKNITAAKYDITKSAISGISTKTYTGKNITQSVKVKYNGKTLKSGTDYTVSYSSNKNVGTATVKITGKGQYGGTVSKTFKINPAKQKIQKLTAKSKAFFIDWAQKGSATGYEVQYATNSKFTGAKKLDVANNKTDKMTISKLLANKKHYVKVRSYTLVKGTKYYGEWSAVKSVTTKK